MVCVAELPDDYIWRAMARTTSAQGPSVDLRSPRRPDLGLSEDGWWSYRFLRSVKKRWTGYSVQCEFLAALPGEPSFPPAIEIPTTPLSQPLNVWPSRETGIGMHLLHRSFGQAISERTMVATASALEGAGEMPLSFASPNVDEPGREASSDALVDQWESIR